MPTRVSPTRRTFHSLFSRISKALCLNVDTSYTLEKRINQVRVRVDKIQLFIISGIE